MKKLKIMMITVLMLFGFTPYVKANSNMYVTNKGFEITYEQLNNLKGLGFSKEEIDLMEEDELNYNKDTKASLVATDIKYSKIVYKYRLKRDSSIMSYHSNPLFNIIKDDYIDDNEENRLELIDTKSYDITEDEYNRIGEVPEYSINGEDIVETTGKKLVTTISYLSSSNRYRFKNSLTWKNMPKNRYNDLFGIIYQEPNANTIVGSQRAYYNYTIYNGCTGKSSSYQDNYSNANNWNTKNKSYYLNIKLKEDETKVYDWPKPTLGKPEIPCPCINPPALHALQISRVNSVQKMSATMYYDIGKSTSTKVKMLTVAGEYQHAYVNIDLNIGLGFGIPSGELTINITPELIKKYDGMKNTRVQLSGLNW